MTLRRSQRFSRQHPCPICGGHADTSKAKERCEGYLEGRSTARCSGKRLARNLSLDPESQTFAHSLEGACGCGVRHIASARGAKDKPSRTGQQNAEPAAPDSEEVDGEDEQGASGREGHADKLVRLVLEGKVELFSDPTGEAWARIRVEDHHEIWSCDGRQFKRWLSRLYWKNYEKALNSQTISAALNVLSAKALFDGPEFELHNRVARHDGAIWYDLADQRWRAVRVRAAGWRVVQDVPILFRRYAHQSAQVTPAPGGDLHRILEFINLKDPAQQLLFLVELVCCLVPDIPHPIPVLHGPQGAAKTTASRMRRRIVDPSVAETLSIPGDKVEMVQMIAHHWVVVFDNLTVLPDWASDILCRASTGEGSSKRVLYTDDDDLIYRYKRCCGINGINIAAQKADLLDRCLLFHLEPIPSERRRSEEELWGQFENERSRLVGAALTALSKAVAIRPTVKLPALTRMADFALWGCAIAEALGHSRSEFLAAVDKNFTDRNEEVLASNPIAAMVIALMEDRAEWEGSPSELYAGLKGLADGQCIDTRSKPWPRAPQALTRRLNEIRPNLAAAGIQMAGGQGRRGLRLFKTPGNTVRSVLSVKAPVMPRDSTDGTTDAAARSDRGSAALPAPRTRKADGSDGMDGIPPTLARDPRLDPCPRCRGTRFYTREGGVVTCAACLPPSNPGAVEAWFRGGDDAS